MKHYVFCAGTEIPKNQLSIAAALRTARLLENMFDLDNDCVENRYHSAIKIEEDNLNTQVSFENDDVHQLIEDCMIWAKEYISQKEQVQNLLKNK